MRRQVRGFADAGIPLMPRRANRVFPQYLYGFSLLRFDDRGLSTPMQLELTWQNRISFRPQEELQNRLSGI